MSSNDPLFVSKSNKRGLTLFLAISLVVVFLPRISTWLKTSSQYIVSSEEISRLTEARERFETKRTFFHFRKNKYSKFKSPVRKFDPNTYTQMQWEALGLSPKQAAVVVRFCQRGIYSNDQLQKIFVIPEQLYVLIKDSTFYPQKAVFDVSKSTENIPIEEKLVLVDVNRADLEELDKIPGIGSFFAKNILNYRTKLGGFVRKEQLLEVWKMDPVKYAEIERFVYIDPNTVSKMKINEVSAEELKRHPYFNWSIANSIVKMRAQKKTFHSIDELKESVLIDQELFEKIKPYITL
jgi:competence protein ComEA